MSSPRDDVLIRFDPRKDGDTKFEVLTTEMAPVLTKISDTRARFVFTTRERNTHQTISATLYEVGESGPIKEITTTNTAQRVRALEDYPNQGDPAEFWLIRTAYVKGVWDGEATKISDLAKLLNINLKKTPARGPANLRAPDLDHLNYSNVDPDALVGINKWSLGSAPGHVILVDNVPKYYLHATAPWLVDDIVYRKVKNLDYEGFVELDLALTPEYYSYDNLPLKAEPSCIYSLAVTPDDLISGSSEDLTSVVIPLPFYTHHQYTASAELPSDFLPNLEIIDAINFDKGMRAVALGYYTSTDIDDGESSFTLYLSRKNSLFVPIASQVVECHFIGNYSTDYIRHDNHYTLMYESVSLWLNGQHRMASIDDVFLFDNTMRFSKEESSTDDVPLEESLIEELPAIRSPLDYS